MAGIRYLPPKFDYHSSNQQFAISQQQHLTLHPDERYQYIATGALVFDTTTSSEPRILLLQRAADDSSPDKWEVPGGACDDEDETILHGLARELWEESALETGYVDALVGEPQYFTSRSGKKICKLFFLVHAKTRNGKPLSVNLDPKEHQQYLWASENEVKAKNVGQVEIEFASQALEDVIMQSFKVIGKD